ncbi:MAG: 2-hydroxychromene-2-carboxylate isomerase [Rhodospirillaceae bacterium]|nr:2-hydroxychromene-2-carboxylate isomerase [Rhodospirillaceae bacterium]
MPAADWYFDFLSPFSYLQLAQFDRLPPDLEVTYRPVLFAGLLAHWEHKGPAEIPAKRVQTYRWCHWYAARHGIPFRMPPAHPFNPLRPLRLAVARGAEPALIRVLFDAIWAEGRDPSQDEEWRALTGGLGIADADEMIAKPEVKEALRRGTEEAAEHGVFGIPTFVIGDEVFWGLDTTDLVLDYLNDPTMLETGEYARISDLPIAQARKL